MDGVEWQRLQQRYVGRLRDPLCALVLQSARRPVLALCVPLVPGKHTNPNLLTLTLILTLTPTPTPTPTLTLTLTLTLTR